MTTNIIVTCPSNEDLIPATEHTHLLQPPSQPSTTFKSYPPNENDRICILPLSRSALEFPNTGDDEDLINTDEITRRRSFNVNSSQRPPSDIRINIYPDTPYQELINTDMELSNLKFEKENDNTSNTSLDGVKSSKENRVDYLRRTLLDHRFSRRIHSSFSSSLTIRSINRRRSTQNYSQRSNRRQVFYLSKNSKWHFVRKHLHDIAMMSESYARMKLAERDLRWIHLRELIRKRVLDMREMSILRQQEDGLLKKSQKTSFDLKAIPTNEVVHVEHDGQVYSIGTRDLVLGRLIGGDDDIKLDTFAQLDARRKFRVKHNLLKRQEGKTRLKKHIAFSFCLCNLSFIVLMFASMFIFATKTIIELKSREFF